MLHAPQEAEAAAGLPHARRCRGWCSPSGQGSRGDQMRDIFQQQRDCCLAFVVAADISRWRLLKISHKGWR